MLQSSLHSIPYNSLPVHSYGSRKTPWGQIFVHLTLTSEGSKKIVTTDDDLRGTSEIF